MKLVSDFDGVWTRPDAEAAAQGDELESRIVAWAPESARPRVREWLAAARASVASEPTRYGWASGGRITAFGDEDPFTAHSGLLHFVQLSAERDPVAAAIRDAVAARGFSLEQIGARSHAAGVARVVAARGPGVLAEAAAAGRAMLEAGAEIVLVSNSPREKLEPWLAHAGVASVAHPERASRAVRLRGDARKFALDAVRRDPLVLGDVSIETARPDYERVLLEEHPDAVVGDVFSLDLALPLRLKRREPDWQGLRVMWLIQPYTPSWLRARVSRHALEVEPIQGGFPGVAAALTRDAR